ncbi:MULTISPECIES: GNAT family N-acetyltransferase [Aeromonas]|jgi:GNAT superfamily N-acetyltransferase|uniref:GNAT family N-acetyltransferase n=1 Tax=Aeromonas bestiarum TaxID=105751 RepID=A0ABT7PVR5_9GAMM|nr:MULTISPECIES: GNAT family N-acetyltransferase [Aeromonas]MCH7346178.1 GNAT family N-acetyltransferase [Aeromonas sp. MR7]MDM5071011.1 GNAT family N-acetyltransferase [Aeromonas bestiarum]
MQGVSLRMARPDDAPAMTVMQRASWLAAYGEVLGADMLAQLSVTEHLQIWQSRLAESGPRPMLLCQDEVVIGLLYWQLVLDGTEPNALIRAFYLHPDHWRQGHGKRLWQAVAMQMRRAGCDSVRLWLLDGNRIGEGFYLRRGFVFDGQERTLMSLGQACLQRQMFRLL